MISWKSSLLSFYLLNLKFNAYNVSSFFENAHLNSKNKAPTNATANNIYQVIANPNSAHSNNFIVVNTVNIRLIDNAAH